MREGYLIKRVDDLRAGIRVEEVSKNEGEYERKEREMLVYNMDHISFISIFLDDNRTADGFTHTVRTVEECIKLLDQNPGRVSYLSLDHDLGSETSTGYDVVLWLEEKAANNCFGVMPQFINVHSRNPVGAGKMIAGLKNVIKIAGDKNISETRIPIIGRLHLGINVEGD